MRGQANDRYNYVVGCRGVGRVLHMVDSLQLFSGAVFKKAGSQKSGEPEKSIEGHPHSLNRKGIACSNDGNGQY